MGPEPKKRRGGRGPKLKTGNPSPAEARYGHQTLRQICSVEYFREQRNKEKRRREPEKGIATFRIVAPHWVYHFKNPAHLGTQAEFGRHRGKERKRLWS